MSIRLAMLLTCGAACAAPVRSDPVEHIQRVELVPPTGDSGPGGRAAPAVDLSGAWVTGSTNEPAIRRVVRELQCNHTPSFWVIEQRGDTVRAWTNPQSWAQGIATPPRPRPAVWEGRLAGVDVTMTNGGSRYVLRYDQASGHLRGTFDGVRFWAVRQELIHPHDCIPVP